MVRVIPRLDVKGPNLVKGIHLEGLRVLGAPGEFARFYYEQGADELLFMDVVASLYERNSLSSVISETARNVFIPITVGGGLRTIDDIRAVLGVGADKVAINTAAFKDISFITRAVKEFGSSTIVGVLEVIEQSKGSYHCFTDNGREETGMEALDWALRLAEAGVGEILVTSVDRDGTGNGFDLELCRIITDALTIPVTLHGGASNVIDVATVIENCKPSAVSISSAFHYRSLFQLRELDPDRLSRLSGVEGNFEFLKGSINYGKISGFTISQLKEHLLRQNIEVRMPDIEGM